MEPETEVIVFGILIAYLNIFARDIEVLLLYGRVQLVVVEHSGRLYAAIEGNLIPVAMEKEPFAPTDFLNGGVVALIHPAWYDAPGAILPSLPGLYCFSLLVFYFFGTV